MGYDPDEYEKGADGIEAPEGRGGVVVGVKYIGTQEDQHDMSMLGRKQVLRVWFGEMMKWPF